MLTIMCSLVGAIVIDVYQGDNKVNKSVSGLLVSDQLTAITDTE
jgi:hypothetical protein